MARKRAPSQASSSSAKKQKPIMQNKVKVNIAEVLPRDIVAIIMSFLPNGLHFARAHKKLFRTFLSLPCSISYKLHFMLQAAKKTYSNSGLAQILQNTVTPLVKACDQEAHLIEQLRIKTLDWKNWLHPPKQKGGKGIQLQLNSMMLQLNCLKKFFLK